MCVGPWKPIHLEAYTTRIADMRTETKIEPSEAAITVRATLGGSTHKALTATLTLVDPSGESHEVTSEVAANASVVDISTNVTNPKLWYPVGQGQQSLYKVILAISDGTSVLSTSEKRIGLRTVKIVQKSLEGESEGGSFYFEVNGASLFAGGMCPIGNEMRRLTN